MAQNYLFNIPYSQEFVLQLNEINNNEIGDEYNKIERYCSILTYPLSWDSTKALIETFKLDLNKYPNLFIFVFNNKIFSTDERTPMPILLRELSIWPIHRPIIIQTTPKNDEIIFYFKDVNSKEFTEIKGNIPNDFLFNDFPTFLNFVSKCKQDLINYRQEILEILPKINDSKLILKFIGALDFSDDYFFSIALKLTENAKIDKILALMNGFFDEEGKIEVNEYNLLKFLSIPYAIPLEINGNIVATNTSLLYYAVKNGNRNLVDNIVEIFSSFVQRLPLEHQIEITTLAFENSQFDILCSLLETADFPFPNNLFGLGPITDEIFNNVIDAREEFHNNIRTGNKTGIKKFANDNPHLKFAYDHENKSAFCQALDVQNYESFFLLRSYGFKDIEDTYHKNKMTDEAIKIAKLQREENVKDSTQLKNMSAMILSAKSKVYIRNSTKVDMEKCENQIYTWFKNIYNTEFGSKLMNAAAQCADLQIIFDFDCDSVENSDVSLSADNYGVTYPVSKLIFIGAKSSDDKQQEQRIKGVLAHEICHYVMRLVYQNDEKPFLKNDDKAAQDLTDIVIEIKNMLKVQNINADQQAVNKDIDQCDKIVSSVFDYDEKDHIVELIVRPVHIQAQFDDKPEKVEELQILFRNLFVFFEKRVIPDVMNFSLKIQENIKNFNGDYGFLSEFNQINYKLRNPRPITDLSNEKFVIIMTNVPKLGLANFYNCLYASDENCLDTRNIFITSEILKKQIVLKKFNNIMSSQNNPVTVFLDCTTKIPKKLKYNEFNNFSKIIFIVSKTSQRDSLKDALNKLNIYSQIQNVKFDINWVDLNQESQKKLLSKKILFQNNCETTLFDLLAKPDCQSEEQIQENFSGIFDSDFLNVLLEKPFVTINANFESDSCSTYLETLFQKRSFIKKNKSTQNRAQDKNLEKIDILKRIKESKTSNILSGLKEFLNINDPEQLKKKKKIQKPIIEIEKLMEPLKKIKEVFKDFRKVLNEFESSKIVETIEPEQLFQNNEKGQIVLISDDAGSGKSWMLRNMSNIFSNFDSKVWITYVDLKQHIKALKSPILFSNFETLMLNEILKSKTMYEKNVFKKFYENGKICIFFDGFDEIAPNYAKVVTDVLKSLEFNGGNQVWIATRDYFEEDLIEKLDLEDYYKLSPFTINDGINLIAESWMLKETRSKCEQNSEKNNIIREKCEAKARNFGQKIKNSVPNFFGSPQFYKMIADVFENEADTFDDMTILKVYAAFVRIKIDIWSKNRGELKNEEYLDCQKKKLSPYIIHQYQAIINLFSEYKDTKLRPKICDLTLSDIDWDHNQIVNVGLMTKNGENIFFIHETFCEYFAAEFMIRVLIYATFDEQSCFFLFQFLTVRKFRVVRLFLNEAFGYENQIEQIKSKLSYIVINFCKYFQDMENLSEVFKENHENLMIFLIEIFEIAVQNEENYEKIKTILNKNHDMISVATKYPSLFARVHEFIINFFKKPDLEDFIKNNYILLSIVNSNLDEIALNNVLQEIKEKTSSNFFTNALKAKNKNGDNIFVFSIYSKYNYTTTPKKTIQVLSNYFSATEIVKMIMEVNNRGFNILHTYIMNHNNGNLSNVCRDVGDFFKDQNLLDNFKALCVQKNSDKNCTFLHLAALHDCIELHIIVWETLVNIYQNLDELKNLLMLKDDGDNSFIHILVQFSNKEVIDYTIQQIINLFTINQRQSILKSRGMMTMNLLQLAVHFSNDIDVHQKLWDTFKYIFSSNEEYLDYLSNLFLNAVTSSSTKLFEFMVNEFEKMSSIKQTAMVLSKLGKNNENLLQRAAVKNESVEFNKFLWKIFRKYFTLKEISYMIKHEDEDGDHILLNVVSENTKEVMEFIWNEIESVVNANTDFDILQYLGHLNKKNLSILYLSMLSEDEKKLKFVWEKLEVYFPQDQCQQIKKFCLQQSIDCDSNFLFPAAICERKEFHCVFWDHLLRLFNNREELADLILQGENNNLNFIHVLVMKNNKDVVEFVLNQLDENFNNYQKKKILGSLGKFRMNIIQMAASSSEDICYILWKFLQNLYKSGNELILFLKHQNLGGENVFNLIASHSTSEIFEFFVEKLKEIASPAEVKKVLKSTGIKGQNLFFAAAVQNESLEFHKSLWKTTRFFFNNSEIVSMIKCNDDPDDNIFSLIVDNNKTEILEYMWEEIINLIVEGQYDSFNDLRNFCYVLLKNFTLNVQDENEKTTFKNKIKEFMTTLNTEHCKKVLKKVLEGDFSVNDFEVLEKLASCNNKENYIKYWEKLLNKIDKLEELKNFILMKDSEDNNFIHILILNNNIEIITYTFELIKKKFTREQYYEILLSRGNYKRNILQIAACLSPDDEVYQFLWRILNDISKYDEDFLTKLMKVEKNILDIQSVINIFGSKLDNLDINTYQSICTEMVMRLHAMVSNLNHNDVTENEFYEFAKHASKIDSNKYRKNLQQSLRKNKSDLLDYEDKNDFNDAFLKVSQNEFKTKEEFKDFVLQIDKNGENFIHTIFSNGNLNIIETVFEKLKKNIDNSSYQDFLNSKGKFGRNLLQTALFKSEDINVIKYLVKTIYGRNENFKDISKILRETDENGFNIFLVAASRATSQILEFIIEEFKTNKLGNILNKFLKHSNNDHQNIFFIAMKNNSDHNFHKKLWEIMDANLDEGEIFDMILQMGKNNTDAFQGAIESNTNDIIRESFENINKLLSFKIAYRDKEISLLRDEVYCNLFNFLETINNDNSRESFLKIWKQFFDNLRMKTTNLLLESFLNQNCVEEIGQLLHSKAKCTREYDHEHFLLTFLQKDRNNEKIMQILVFKKDIDGNNFIHLLLYYDNIDIIQLTFKILKNNLSQEQNKEILLSKGADQCNVLQTVATYSGNSFEILWNILRDSFELNEELLNFFIETNSNGMNIFHIAAQFSNRQLFLFLVDKVKNIASINTITRILGSLDLNKRNLLQILASISGSIDTYMNVWKVFKKYFVLLDILELTTHMDEYGLNLFQTARNNNNEEIVEFTMKNISDCLYIACEKFLKFSELNRKFNDYFVHFSEEKTDKRVAEIVKQKLMVLESEIKSERSKKVLQMISNEQYSVNDFNVLRELTTCNEINYHKNYWNKFKKNIENKEKVAKFLVQNEFNGDNFISLLILNLKPEIVRYTFDQLEDYFNEAQYKSILKSTGKYGRNFLQIVVCDLNNLDIFELVWSIFLKTYSSKEDFIEFLMKFDRNGDSFFHLSVIHATKEKFEFIKFKLITALGDKNQIKNFLCHLNSKKQNILQIASEKKFSIEFHQIIWVLIETYFEKSEILQFIKNIDENKNSLLHNAIEYNTESVISFTWRLIKTITNYEEQMEYLKQIGYKNQNLLQISFNNSNDPLNVINWVKNLMQEYNIINEQSNSDNIASANKRKTNSYVNLESLNEPLKNVVKRHKLSSNKHPERKRVANGTEQSPNNAVKLPKLESQDKNHSLIIQEHPKTSQMKALACLSDKRLNIPIQANDLTENLRKLLMKTRNQEDCNNIDEMNLIFINEFIDCTTSDRKILLDDEVIAAVNEVVDDLQIWSIEKWMTNKDKIESILKASFDVISCVEENIDKESEQELERILSMLSNFLKYLS